MSGGQKGKNGFSVNRNLAQRQRHRERESEGAQQRQQQQGSLLGARSSCLLASKFLPSHRHRIASYASNTSVIVTYCVHFLCIIGGGDRDRECFRGSRGVRVSRLAVALRLQFVDVVVPLVGFLRRRRRSGLWLCILVGRGL